MKKVFILLLAFVMCLSLFACGKSSAVTAAEEAISKIGEVTLDSKEAIDAAKAAYDALEDDDKEKVENAYVLDAAVKGFDALLSRCIPNTYIELPEFAINVPNEGSWIVDDRDDFTAYNFWPSDEYYATEGFEAYKEYIASSHGFYLLHYSIQNPLLPPLHD